MFLWKKFRCSDANLKAALLATQTNSNWKIKGRHFLHWNVFELRSIPTVLLELYYWANLFALWFSDLWLSDFSWFSGFLLFSKLQAVCSTTVNGAGRVSFLVPGSYVCDSQVPGFRISGSLVNWFLVCGLCLIYWISRSQRIHIRCDLTPAYVTHHNQDIKDIPSKCYTS